MRRFVEKLSPEDREKHTEVYLRAEVARSSVLSPQETYEALRAELEFMREVAVRYELDGEENWELDPVYCEIYYGVD
jgi:hypothetical protein